MTWTVALVVGIVVAAGVYLALSRDMVRCVLGLSVLGGGVNLMLFASGRLLSDAPPVVAEGLTALGPSANPLPQALVLTAIVIGFALTCLSLVLVVRIAQATGTDDGDGLRYAEPVPEDPRMPPLEEALERSSAGPGDPR